MVVAGPCDAEGARQGKFREIVVVHAGDVLVVRACERLLGLHHFDAIGHTGAEAILRMRQTLIGQDDIFLSDIDLLFRCVEIEKCRTDVEVNLAANVFRFRLSLPERRFGLRDIALNTAPSEKRNADSSLKVECSVRLGSRTTSLVAVPFGTLALTALFYGRRFLSTPSWIGSFVLRDRRMYATAATTRTAPTTLPKISSIVIDLIFSSRPRSERQF